VYKRAQAESWLGSYHIMQSTKWQNQMNRSRETSVLALKKYLASGKRLTHTLRILQLLMETPHPLSEYSIRKTLGLHQNTCSARLSELQEEGLVRAVGRTYVAKQEVNLYAFVPDPEVQNRLRLERLRENYEQWKKRGFEQFRELIAEDLRKGVQGQLNLFANKL